MSIKKEIIKIIKESLDKLDIDISESDIIIDIPKTNKNFPIFFKSFIKSPYFY